MGYGRSTMRRAFAPHPLMTLEETSFGKNNSIVVSIDRRRVRLQSRVEPLWTRWAHGRASEARGKPRCVHVRRRGACICAGWLRVQATHARCWTRETPVRPGCVRTSTRWASRWDSLACCWTREMRACDGCARSSAGWASGRARAQAQARAQEGTSHRGDDAGPGGGSLARLTSVAPCSTASRTLRAAAMKRRCFAGRSPLAFLTRSARGAAGAGLLREAQGRKAKRTC